MILSESEIEIAKKQIYIWEKFEKKWPQMRWYAIAISLLLASTTLALFLSGNKMWEITRQWPVVTNDVSEIKAYLDIRTSVLRGEIIRYVSTTFQLLISAIIFGVTVSCWNRHKYIKLKIVALKSLLEIKTNN